MRWSGRLAVIGIVASLALPTAWSVEQQPVLGGHTTYADMDGLDPCIAGIVGIVRLRVMWFNDQVLFERGAGEGSWVYALQSGAPDPRDAVLAPTGNQFAFTDPNGLDWEVNEYAFHVGPAGDVDGGGFNYSTNPPGAGFSRTPSAETQNVTQLFVWVVQTGPTMQDFAATGRPYNFVSLVDTCKFTAPPSPVQHINGGGGNWSSDWGNDTTEAQHLGSDPSHSHERYAADLYVGKAPKVEFLHNQDPNHLGVPS